MSETMAMEIGNTPATVAEGGSDVFEMPTLGRPLRIGMLYDRRSDMFIPGLTLWDLDALRKNLDVQSKPNTDCSILFSDSIEDKASSLGVEASLKASFLGGLVEVSGSAQYLNDAKTSKRQARVTLNYRATTRFEQLSMSQLGPHNISYPSVFDQGSATHVVTAVLYGAQAFFVFDQQYSSGDDRREVEGKLQGLIKKIPTFHLEGMGAAKLSDAEKKTTENFSCMFHGDFLLGRNPVSYQDALQVYSMLPKLLADHGEKAVPVRVWLYPLTRLEAKAARMVREISVGLVDRCQLVLDQFRDLEMSCNDLIGDTAASRFPELKAKVQTFKEMCRERQAVFQQGLAEILLAIRGTGREESGLADILEWNERSPFSNSALTAWVEKKEKEANTVGGYLAMLEGVEVLTKSQLDTVLADPVTEHVVCFTFTSLWGPDAYLQELSSYLKSPRSLQGPGRTSPGDPGPPKADWFEVESVSQRMRQRAGFFLRFAESNKSYGKTKATESCKFAIASIDDRSCTGASNFLYEQGVLVNKEFKLQKPNVPLIMGKTDCSVTLHLKAPGDHVGQLLMFWVGSRCVEDQDWSWQDTRDGTESFTVSGLHPGKAYQFRFAPLYKPWAGLLSDASASVRTRPAAAPGEVSVLSVQPTSLTVAWAPPARLGDGVSVRRYIVEYREDESREGTWTELRAESRAHECTLGDLRPGTCYRIRVSADCGGAGVGARSQEAVAFTARERSPAPLAERVRRASRLVRDGRPAVYQPPLREELGEGGREGGWRKYAFGAAGSSGDRRKIIVVGDEESGRSDLINGLANYILGVDWADPFRFQLTGSTEGQGAGREGHRAGSEGQRAGSEGQRAGSEGQRAGSEGQRAGSEGRYSVTQYEINHQEGSRVPYSLTIVEANERSLLYLLCLMIESPDLQKCNFVCATIRSSAASLPGAVGQCLTYYRIRKFGMTPQLLITSCDHQSPAVLGALRNSGVDFPRDGEGAPAHFKFNFSGLFAANARPDPTGEGSGEGPGPGPGGRGSGGSGAAAEGRAGGDGWNYNVGRLFWDMTNDSLKRFLMELDSSGPRN